MLQELFTKISLFFVGILASLFPFLHTYSVQIYTATTTPEKNIPQKITEVTPPVQNKTASTSPIKKTIKKEIVVPVPTQKSPALTEAELTALFDQINTNTRKTLVNIFCTVENAPFSGASGTGVLISQDGVILTNAHLGQYFLLKDFDGKKNTVTCAIRTGNPAYPTYRAELVYISPVWVDENKTVLIEQNPTGTGEHDYAFLKITTLADGSPFSGTVPFMPVSVNENLEEHENTLLASYPAGFLGSMSIEKSLYQTTAITQIAKLYTFNSNTIDVISVPGTVISQKGSSGGAVVDSGGSVIGIITTSSEATTTNARDLRAITTAYINRDLLSQVGINLKYLLDNSNAVRDTFNQSIANTLKNILEKTILKN